MSTSYLRVTLGVLAAATINWAAFADDLPRTGEYRIIYTGINTSPAKPMPIGNNQSMIPNQTTMTAVNVAGEGFLHNLTGRCMGAATLDNDAKTIENHGRCVYSDASGDQIFEKWDYPVQAQGMTLKGTAEWTGGTGKFAGVSGDVELSTTRLTSMIDGVVQVSGTKTGRYSFENTVSSLK